MLAVAWMATCVHHHALHFACTSMPGSQHAPNMGGSVLRRLPPTSQQPCTAADQLLGTCLAAAVCRMRADHACCWVVVVGCAVMLVDKNTRPGLPSVAIASGDGSGHLRAPDCGCLCDTFSVPCACSCRTLSFMKSGAAQVRVGWRRGMRMGLGVGVGGRFGVSATAQ